MTTYREFHRRSIDDREGFWAEQAGLVHWHRPHAPGLDYRRPPFARGLVGGGTPPPPHGAARAGAAHRRRRPHRTAARRQAAAVHEHARTSDAGEQKAHV